MIRLYAVALSAEEYMVMPGGLTRAGNSSESVLLAPPNGGRQQRHLGPQQHAAGHNDPAAHAPSFVRPDGRALSFRLDWPTIFIGLDDTSSHRVRMRLARCLLHRITNEAELGQVVELTCLVDLLSNHGQLPADCEAKWSTHPEAVLETAVFDEDDGEHCGWHRQSASHHDGRPRPSLARRIAHSSGVATSSSRSEPPAASMPTNNSPPSKSFSAGFRPSADRPPME